MKATKTWVSAAAAVGAGVRAAGGTRGGAAAEVEVEADVGFISLGFFFWPLPFPGGRLASVDGRGAQVCGDDCTKGRFP